MTPHGGGRSRLPVVRSFLLVSVLAVACRGGCQPARVVVLPPDEAAPRVVLAAWLDALVAGDCATTEALELPSMHVGNGRLCGGIDVSAYTDIEGPAGPRPEVEQEFSAILTTGGSDDGSILPGDLIWFVNLQRTGTGPWRVAGGGTGP